MSLFDTILSSINDPSRKTQASDLSGLLAAFTKGTSKQAGAPASSSVDLAGVVGSLLKPVLKQTQAQSGLQGVDSLLGSLQNNASPAGLKNILGASQVDQIVGVAAQKTGLNAQTILGLLPTVLPAVVGLLQSGKSTGASGAASLGNNPILTQFLDSDGDGDVDMADLLKLGSKFLKK